MMMEDAVTCEVKNTFIHFRSEAPCGDVRGRALRRWETDPDAMPLPAMPTTRRPGIDDVAEEAASQVCSTPERSPRSWACGTPDEQVFSTPEPSPCNSWSTWSEVTGTPTAVPTAAPYASPPSWTSTVASPWVQVQVPLPLALDRQIPSMPPWLEGADAVTAAVAATPGVFGFLFTLRRAEDVGLGLDVDCGQSGRVLLVRKVLRGGAIEAWNRQCLKGPLAKKAVMPGDAIVSINGCSDAESMLQECRRSFLLKILVTRWDPEQVYGAPAAAPVQSLATAQGAQASHGSWGKSKVRSERLVASQTQAKGATAVRPAHHPARLEARVPADLPR